MSGIITGVLALAAAGTAAYASSQSGKAQQAAGMQQSAAIQAAAEGEVATKLSLADELYSKINKARKSYNTQANKVLGGLSFTAVDAPTVVGPDGKSTIDQTFDIFSGLDSARRKALYGENESLIREAISRLGNFAAGNMGALGRVTDTAVQSATRGAAIGAAKDIGAKANMSITLGAIQGLSTLISQLDNTYTPTNTVFQGALQLTDFATREAGRKDAANATKVASQLGVLNTATDMKLKAIVGRNNLQVSAAEALSRGLSGAASVAYNADLARISGDTGATMAIAQGIGALGSAYGTYNASQIQQSALQQQTDLTRAAVAIQGAQAGIDVTTLGLDTFSGMKIPTDQIRSSVQPSTYVPAAKSRFSLPSTSSLIPSAKRTSATASRAATYSPTYDMPSGVGDVDLSLLGNGSTSSAILPPFIE